MLLSAVMGNQSSPLAGLFTLTTTRKYRNLVADPRIDKVSFTGSNATGKRIMESAEKNMTRVHLELGGKSAAVVLDDADLATAAATLAGAECFLTGQVCSSLTRIVVSKHRHDELVDALASTFAKVQVGDPPE